LVVKGGGAAAGTGGGEGGWVLGEATEGAVLGGHWLFLLVNHPFPMFLVHRIFQPVFQISCFSLFYYSLPVSHLEGVVIGFWFPRDRRENKI
jgi:hypothetical protein